MKKYTLALLCVLLMNVAFANNLHTDNFSGGDVNRAAAIDMNDTVVFDMSQSVINGDTIEFPVYFLSDDAINAVDFSFKFDLANFTFDSIINLTADLQPTYNVTADTTLYFTSYSLTTIVNNTPLVLIRFITHGIPVCNWNINTVLVYLNGDPCSYKVIDCLNNGVSEVKNDKLINVFPNPANEILNVSAPEKSMVQLFDMNGRQTFIETITTHNLQINIENIPVGIYTLKISDDDFISVKKVVIQK